MNRDDTGKYFVKSNNQDEIFQMIGWCPEPPIMLQNVRTKEISYIIPSSKQAQEFVKLVKES